MITQEDIDAFAAMADVNTTGLFLLGREVRL